MKSYKKYCEVRFLAAPRTGAYVGIEVETEATIPYSYREVLGSSYHAERKEFTLANVWAAKEDGSLRNYGIEYISSPIKTYKPHVKALVDKLLTVPTLMKECPRAGIHVHVNVTDMTQSNIWTMACIFWTLENALVEWCGESRVGNNFCLRLKDATRVVGASVNAIRSVFVGTERDSFVSFHPNTHKYASLNLATVARLGTLEFRSLDGNLDSDRVNNWTEQLLLLRELAFKFEDPHKFFAWLDLQTDKVSIYKELLTPYFYKTLDIDNMYQRLYTDVGLAMTMAFACPDWDAFELGVVEKVTDRGKKFSEEEIGLNQPMENLLMREPAMQVIQDDPFLEDEVIE